MARPPAFSRSNSRFKPQPRVLVICEDAKSGRRYLEDACRNFRVYALVEVTNCKNTDPKGIIEEAVRRKKQFEYVFCVIDRDSHQNFDEAISIATPLPQLTVVASYPCFEFWLLLHFFYTRKPYVSEGNNSPADEAIHDLRNCLGMQDYAKSSSSNLFDALLERLPVARENARKVLADAEQCKEMNPSTRMHELLDFFERLSKPQPV